MNGLILYTTEDGVSRIQLRADGQTVWLSQCEMAELFAATKQNISLLLKNLIEDGEPSREATVKQSLTVQTEGHRQLQRPVTLYNLDAILAVGYPCVRPAAYGFGAVTEQPPPNSSLCASMRRIRMVVCAHGAR